MGSGSQYRLSRVREEDWLVDPPATIRETETVPIPALRGKIIIVFLPPWQAFFYERESKWQGIADG